MPYKKTLNIPKTDFSMKAGLVANAKKFKAFWSELQLWRQLSTRKEAPPFVLHDGPPYANGDIHIGHALNKILKDFVLRYKALQGHRLHYVPGWDTHGLPIENRIERTEGYDSGSPMQKREACRKYAMEQIERQKAQFSELHLLSDFQDHYRTLDPNFIAHELMVFGRMLESGLLHWCLKPVAWSWSSRTALAEMEIIYRDVESESIYFWFPLHRDTKVGTHTLKKGTRLLIWTTTPYTLEANMAVAVNPKFTYSLIRDSGGNEYVLLRGLADKLGLEGKEIFAFLGRDLDGAEYLNPLTKEVSRVLVADFVSGEAGTGLVHLASGYGLEDYYACLGAGMEVYVSIGQSGHFLPETKFPPINGLFYLEASKVVIDWLRNDGYLYRSETIVHSVGHDWRTEKPLLYRASPQWFINTKKLRGRVEEAFGRDLHRTLPDWIKGRLQTLIMGRSEWCLSRQRVWGTPIPILFDQNDEPIVDPKQVWHCIDILSKEGTDIWFSKEPEYFLHPDLREKYGGAGLKKSRDILDVWFDSGCSWGILGEDVVADLYLEGFDQLRGWFNSSAIASLAVRDKLPFEAIVSHGFVLDGNGNKMSKSKGNVVDPLELVQEYGVDVVRLWVALNNYTEDIRISRESMTAAVSLYRKIRNTVFRYSLSVLPQNFEVDWMVLKNLEFPENQYMYQTFFNAWTKIEDAMEGGEFWVALNLALDFINLYSGWYLEVCKDTLYCDPKTSKGYRETSNIIGMVFERFMALFAVFMPQTAEEAWGHYRADGSSVFLGHWPRFMGQDYRVDWDLWNNFRALRDEVNERIEALRRENVVSGSTEVKVVMPEERIPKGLDLVKLLNVAEVEVGEEMGVFRSELQCCLRCRRRKSDVSDEGLCYRCQRAIG